MAEISKHPADTPAATLPLPPGPRGHWPMGNYPEFNKDPLRFMLDLRRQYGDVVHTRFFVWDAFMVSHPDYIKHILQENNRNYHKQFSEYKKLSWIVGNGLLTSDGDFWLRQRRLAMWLRHLPTPRNREFDAAMDTLNEVVNRIISSRRQNRELLGNDDLLSMLMQARDEETGEGMTDKQLRDEVMTLMLAGHETTANALTWTFYLLSKHPQVRSKLEEEVDRVPDGRPPTTEDVADLSYTKMVIEESMRLYPPAYSIGRAAKEDDVIGGYRIPTGSGIFMSSYVVHRHPDFWHNPEGFAPERFLPERVQERPNFAYFPFGGGPRLCIGRDFAMMEAQLILATISQRYQLHLLPGHPVRLQPLITLRPRHGMVMTVHERNR